MTGIPHLGAWIVLVGVVAAVAFMVAGVLKVVRAAKRLSARVDGVKTQPILALIEETQRKVDAAQYAVGTFPDLLERARRALLELERARERLRSGADAVKTAGRLIGSLFAQI